MTKKTKGIRVSVNYNNLDGYCASVERCPYKKQYEPDPDSIKYYQGLIETPSYGPYDSVYEEYGRGEDDQCKHLLPLFKRFYADTVSIMNFNTVADAIQFNSGNPLATPRGIEYANFTFNNFLTNLNTPPHNYYSCVPKKYYKTFDCQPKDDVKRYKCGICKDGEEVNDDDDPLDDKKIPLPEETITPTNEDLPDLIVPLGLGTQICETGIIVELEKNADNSYNFILVFNSVDILTLDYIFLGEKLIYTGLYNIQNNTQNVVDVTLVNKSTSSRGLIGKVGYRDFTYLYFKNFSFAEYTNRTNFKVIFTTSHSTDKDVVQTFSDLEDRLYKVSDLSHVLRGYKYTPVEGGKKVDLLKDLYYSRDIKSYELNGVRYFYYTLDKNIVNLDIDKLKINNSSFTINNSTKVASDISLSYTPAHDTCTRETKVLTKVPNINDTNNTEVTDGAYDINFILNRSEIPPVAERLLQYINNSYGYSSKLGISNIDVPTIFNIMGAPVKYKNKSLLIETIRLNPYQISTILEGKEITNTEKVVVNEIIEDGTQVIPTSLTELLSKYNLTLIQNPPILEFFDEPPFHYFNSEVYFSYASWYFKCGIKKESNMVFPVRIDIPHSKKHFTLEGYMLQGTVVDSFNVGQRSLFGGFENNIKGSYITIDFDEDVTQILKQYSHINEMAYSTTDNAFSINKALYQARTYEDLGNNRIKFIDILIGKNVSIIRDPQVGETCTLYKDGTIFESTTESFNGLAPSFPVGQQLQLYYRDTSYTAPASFFHVRSVEYISGITDTVRDNIYTTSKDRLFNSTITRYTGAYKDPMFKQVLLPLTDQKFGLSGSAIPDHPDYKTYTRMSHFAPFYSGLAILYLQNADNFIFVDRSYNPVIDSQLIHNDELIINQETLRSNANIKDFLIPDIESFSFASYRSITVISGDSQKREFSAFDDNYNYLDFDFLTTGQSSSSNTGGKTGFYIKKILSSAPLTDLSNVKHPIDIDPQYKPLYDPAFPDTLKDYFFFLEDGLVYPFVETSATADLPSYYHTDVLIPAIEATPNSELKYYVNYVVFEVKIGYNIENTIKQIINNNDASRYRFLPNNNDNYFILKSKIQNGSRRLDYRSNITEPNSNYDTLRDFMIELRDEYDKS